MIRNLKILGLALAAMFAFSAVASSAAFAEDPQGELTSDGSVTLDITEDEEKVNALTAFGESVECPGSKYTGHLYTTENETSHAEKTNPALHDGLIPSGSTKATITPHYNQPACTVNEGEHKATVTMNGCDYVFHVGDTVSGVDKYAVTADVVCPPGQHIIVHIYFAAGNENIKACDVTVGPQNGLTGATVRTDTSADPHDLVVEGTFHNIVAVQTGLCGHDTTSEGEFHINATVEGTNAAGGATAITVTDTRN